MTWIPFLLFAGVIWIICAGTGANPLLVGAFLIFLLFAGGGASKT